MAGSFGIEHEQPVGSAVGRARRLHGDDWWQRYQRMLRAGGDEVYHPDMLGLDDQLEEEDNPVVEKSTLSRKRGA